MIFGVTSLELDVKINKQPKKKKKKKKKNCQLVIPYIV
jgi:hypothetical protein